MFNSNFKKEHIKNIPIAFGKGQNRHIKRLEDVCSLLDAKKEDKDFCYLFYRRKKADNTCETEEREISVVKFCQELINSLENVRED